MSADTHTDVLQENVCKALPLTEVNFVCNNLHTCLRMKRWDRVIVKFKCCKQKRSLIYKYKNLGNKSWELMNLKFLGRLFCTKSISYKNKQLVYVSNSRVPGRYILHVANIKLTRQGRIHKYFMSLAWRNNLEE